MLKLVRKERIGQEHHYAPSVSAIDSQSIKKSAFVSIETGIDEGKHINGRKRHLAVDSVHHYSIGGSIHTIALTNYIIIAGVLNTRISYSNAE